MIEHKIIAVDCNLLVIWTTTTKTNADNRARIEHLFNYIEKSKGKMIIPMPAIAEFLVKADIMGVEFLNQLERKNCVILGNFDRPSAYECAQMDSAALGRSDKKDGAKDTWQKVKVDRQIIAISKTLGATMIITNDKGVETSALRTGMSVCSVQDLPIPDKDKQLPLLS